MRTRLGEPVARLVPPMRILGRRPGEAEVGDGFDALDDEIAKAFDGDDEDPLLR